MWIGLVIVVINISYAFGGIYNSIREKEEEPDTSVWILLYTLVAGSVWILTAII